MPRLNELTLREKIFDPDFEKMYEDLWSDLSQLVVYHEFVELKFQ